MDDGRQQLIGVEAVHVARRAEGNDLRADREVDRAEERGGDGGAEQSGGT